MSMQCTCGYIHAPNCVWYERQAENNELRTKNAALRKEAEAGAEIIKRIRWSRLYQKGTNDYLDEAFAAYDKLKEVQNEPSTS